MKTVAKSILLAMMGYAAVPSASAVPLLQLYVEGATYDSTSETWVYTGTDPIRLWAIGNVDGDGGKGTIYDVKLAIAYADGLTPNFSLTSSTTGGYGGFIDPSTPGAAVFSKTVTDGSAPILGDGSSLPTHGIYGSGTDWTEYLLGDFSLTDSQIEDFITSFPTPDATTDGQINVYEIAVTGVAAGTTFHFDLYDHVAGGNDFRYVFAPFSHDGEATSSSGGGGGSTGGGGGSTGNGVPEPGVLGLLGAGLLGQGLLLARRRRSKG